MLLNLCFRISLYISITRWWFYALRSNVQSNAAIFLSNQINSHMLMLDYHRNVFKTGMI